MSDEANDTVTTTRLRDQLRRWTSLVPILGLVALALTWGRYELPGWALAINGLLLGASVLAAVHHAEVIAHKVGEPFGSLVLALAVTVIEVGLILTLMLGGGAGTDTLARDTVFGAVMITTTGMVGICLLVAGTNNQLSYFNPEGAGAAFATMLTLTVLTMVLPVVTTSAPRGRYVDSQLVFVALSSLVLWALFVLTQTVRHRDFFLPVDRHGQALSVEHADPPSHTQTLLSGVLLLVALVAVVGLAKTLSGAIEDLVASAGFPLSFVGVVIAMLVLLPEMIAAARNARRHRVQVSLNLAYGSAIASIGLTIPVISVIAILYDTPLELGLTSTHIALLVLTGFVSVLTIVPGRATRLQGGVLMAIFAAFVFLSAVP